MIAQLVLLVLFVIVIFNLQNKRPKIQLVWFFSPNCGHCVNMMEEWRKLKYLASVQPELAGLRVWECNVDDPQNKSLVESFQIQGVPAIFKLVRGHAELYAGPRDYNSILAWCYPDLLGLKK